MELHEISSIRHNVKVAFAITIVEKVFSAIREGDDRYTDGREALMFFANIDVKGL